MLNKLESFMDAYVAFVDYGVRGWLVYSGITFICFAFFLFGALTQELFAIISLVSIGVLIALWSRDYALGYVPVWWLKLGDKAYR